MVTITRTNRIEHTKVMVEHVDAFMKRPLEKRYVCIYIDATYIAVKRETVSKEAVYIAVGIREDGTKEVLTYAVAPTESAYIWKELLQDVKERGTEQVLLFISDGLTGIVNAIQEIYRNTRSVKNNFPMKKHWISFSSLSSKGITSASLRVAILGSNKHGLNSVRCSHQRLIQFSTREEYFHLHIILDAAYITYFEWCTFCLFELGGL